MENEIKSFENEYYKEKDENYNSKMNINKDKEFQMLGNDRFGLEMHLHQELIK